MFLATQNFGVGAGGWSSQDLYPRELSDVNGDGTDDIVGFGNAGVIVALADDSGLFGAANLVLPAFGPSAAAGGWSSQNLYPRELADVNDDGLGDIVGFGNAGVIVALANGSGSFDAPDLVFPAFGASAAAGGWSSQDLYPRELSDVNGDGFDDIIGFGNAGVIVALADGDGSFGAANLVLPAFGASAAAGGWSSQNLYPRQLSDVNGDGFDDIIGFGNAGVIVALANGFGSFGAANLVLPAFGASAAAGGWSSQDLYPRQLADVNDDGLADIVGFGNAGVIVALANDAGSFDAAELVLPAFGASAAAGGWSSQNLYPRRLADVNGDGFDDIVGFGNAGVIVALATGTGDFL